MIERILLLVAFSLVVVALIVGGRLIARARQRAVRASAPSDLWQALSTVPDGRPTLVAFSSPRCGVCKTTQAPAIERLEATLGEQGVRVLKVDVASKPDVADAFGVLTLPTTVVLTRPDEF